MPSTPPPVKLAYAVHDTTLICVSNGAATAQYHRVSFSGSEKAPQATVADTIDLGAADSIRGSRAITDTSGNQHVAILTRTGLSVISMVGTASHSTPVAGTVDNAVLIVGIDPIHKDKRWLNLLCTAGAGFAIVGVDLESGTRMEPRVLPASVRGTAVAAELVRDGSAIKLVIVTIDNGSLVAHAVACDKLEAQVDEKQITTLNLGRIANIPDVQVGTAVTSMTAGTQDQQLAIAWPATATAASLAVIGFQPNGVAVVLAQDAPVVSFAPPEKAVYRLAAADVLHAGSDQLVIGYPATYGKAKGCAALMLYTLDTSAAALRMESKYVAAGTHGQPLASIDLHLGAGVFGTCMGVQIVGGGASFQDLRQGSASVLCAFVPVDPLRRAFPEMDPQLPGTPFMCTVAGAEGGRLTTISPQTPMFRAFPSGLNGQSIFLGSPSLSSVPGCMQILAIIQAPPFERRCAVNQPSVNYATTTGDASGCSVTSDKSYSLSHDASVNLGLGSLSLSETTHDTYLKSLSTMDDNSSTSSVSFHSTVSSEDWMLVYQVDYDVWSYPITRSGSKDKSGEMLVIIPQPSASKNWVPAHTYGYKTPWEPGLLTSYIDVAKPGYKPENLLFERDAFTVSTLSDTSSLTFDKTTSKATSETTHVSVLNSVSDHAGFTAATELFDCLPLSFGINLGKSESHANSDVKTTHLTVHSSLSLGIGSGSVTDPKFEYQISPSIYHHDKLGCLMLAYTVKAIGQAWRTREHGGDSALASPHVCLIRVVPDTKDLVFRAFSRSISFKVNLGSDNKPNGTTDIVAEVFNDSYELARGLTCKFYSGKPTIDNAKLMVPDKLLGEVKFADVDSLRRVPVVLKDQALTNPMWVTVQLFMGVIPQGIYWNVYPPTESIS